MRVLGFALLAGCSFDPPPALQDGPVDMPPDMPDMMTQRVTTGLIGFWTFNDATGATSVKDTSGHAMAVDLQVQTSAAGMIFAPSFAGGTVTADLHARVISNFSTHLPADCQSASAVTLEAWVKPGVAVQGDATTPRFITGMATNTLSRAVVLLQAGDRWVARVRTNASADGAPALVSQSAPDPTKYTHLVVVADQNQRTLYVDDVAEATDPLVGGPSNWDLTSRLAMFEEPQGGRFWLGSLQIVALFQRGLLPAEIDKNFQLGPAAP